MKILTEEKCKVCSLLRIEFYFIETRPNEGEKKKGNESVKFENFW